MVNWYHKNIGVSLLFCFKYSSVYNSNKCEKSRIVVYGTWPELHVFIRWELQ